MVQVDKSPERINGILSFVHDVPCGCCDAKLHGFINMLLEAIFILRGDSTEHFCNLSAGFLDLTVLSPGLKLFLEVAAESHRIGRFGGTVAAFFGRGRLFRCGVHVTLFRHHRAGGGNLIR